MSAASSSVPSGAGRRIDVVDLVSSAPEFDVVTEFCGRRCHGSLPEGDGANEGAAPSIRRLLAVGRLLGNDLDHIEFDAGMLKANLSGLSRCLVIARQSARAVDSSARASQRAGSALKAFQEARSHCSMTPAAASSWRSRARRVCNPVWKSSKVITEANASGREEVPTKAVKPGPPLG